MMLSMPWDVFWFIFMPLWIAFWMTAAEWLSGERLSIVTVFTNGFRFYPRLWRWASRKVAR